MAIIPAINEVNFEEIKKKVLLVQSFGSKWAHLDVADGKFTKNVLWNNPEELKVESEKWKVKIEVHLMVESPEDVLEEWLKTGIKRIFVHYESIKDFELLRDKCRAAGVELGLAIGPHIPVEGLFEYKGRVSYFLILAVEPGISGQEFQDNQLEKIRVLREKIPNAKIEVDGGINIRNAFDIKQAGADVLVSSSYIWNSGNPKEAYEFL